VGSMERSARRRGRLADAGSGQQLAGDGRDGMVGGGGAGRGCGGNATCGRRRLVGRTRQLGVAIGAWLRDARRRDSGLWRRYSAAAWLKRLTTIRRHLGGGFVPLAARGCGACRGVIRHD